jgi:hypothetical protein
MREKYPFNFLQLADELFGNDLSYVAEFCERIKHYGISYRISTRIDRVSDSLLRMLSDSGCKEILFGIEHTADRILESMQKKTKAAYIEPALRKCVEYGITPVGNIIFGDLKESEETVKEALEWWKEHHHLGNITTTYLIVFPGSYVYKAAVEHGIIKDPVQFLRDGCPLVNITTMKDDKWSEMKDMIANYRILYETSNDINTDTLSANLDWLANSDTPAAVWPATIDSVCFFRQMSKSFYDKAVFLNVNPESQMLRSSDESFIVFTPDVIPKKSIDTIVCPRESLIEQIKSICATQFPTVKRVFSVRQLGNMKREDKLYEKFS